MASAIDVSKPQTGEAYTQDVRDNFTAAAAEISALQESIGGMAAGSMTIGTPPTSIVISVGVGAPGSATPGFDMQGSLYVDSQGPLGTVLYMSGGDGTWSALG
jgi:hypothetical protein